MTAPSRRVPLARRKPLPAGKPLARRTQLASHSSLTSYTGLQRYTGLRPASTKRTAENRERARQIKAAYPDGRALCAAPGPSHWADDIHEPLTRARGGSITDPANRVPLCRRHHDQVTFAPESELGWAYDLGLLRHSWDKDGAS